MAMIRPFMAIRPAKGMEQKIAALPYDVYNRQEAKDYVTKNPESFLAIDRAETQFDDSVDTYADCVYEKAGQMLRDRIAKRDFVRDSANCYYVYEQTMEGRTQTGIVACASIDDYENNLIKKHENTRADKEVDRIRHVDTCNAQTGPIFLAYRKNDIISEIVTEVKLENAVYDFTSKDNIRHRVWMINQQERINKIQNAFAEMNAIYIADGHHRCASAVKVGKMRRRANPNYSGAEEFNYFLSVLFPDEELMIMDYNRVIKDLNGRSSNEFMKMLADSFVIGEAGTSSIKPTRKGEIALYIDKKWYLLTMKEHVKKEDPVDGLDVSILQNEVLDKLLNIKDPKTDQRIDFVGGIRGLEELERRANSDCVAAFAMYPTSIHELFAVADANRLMPPKSTWFEPKLRSGIFIHDIL
ncbi:MAG TPA: DUF1015 family protein [Lachnospiraceae bacterium]|nr:DUF1015 family protein [Lachnospiraceae bacterium]